MKIELIDEEIANPAPGCSWHDSHVHFDGFDREGVLERVVERCRGCGVNGLTAIGGSDEANARAVRIADTYPDLVQAVVGFDRDLAGKQPDEDHLRALVAERGDRICGIGESGLDYHYEPDSAPEQKELFASMLDVAAERTRPIVVHSREAEADTLDMLRSFVRNWKGDAARPGVLHCFTGSYGFASRLIDIGMMISFSGILTFRNADELRDCARRLPLDRILIETDAPYLAPVPYRGKTNEPAMVVKVGETLASIRSVTLQEVAEQTVQNACFLFQHGEQRHYE